MCDTIRTRVFQENDIPVLLQFTAADGWTFSEADLRAQLAIDPVGLTVAEDGQGQHLGFIGHFSMTNDKVFIDVFVTRKDVRGKGIGKLLWQEMLRITEGKVHVLESVMTTIPWYKTHGFEFVQYKFHVYTGTVPNRTRDKTSKQEHSVRSLSGDMWPDIVAYDRQVFPFDRETFLRALYDPERSVTLVAFTQGRLSGFANIHQRNNSGYNIRGLFADNQDVAEVLLESLLDKVSPEAEVTLCLMDGKELLRGVEHFQCSCAVEKLSTKRIELSNIDKIYIPTTHIV